MGDLPEIMAVLSRRSKPRLRLEAGAVVTAMGLTVVHNISTPGGWHVIGRTPASLFDLRWEWPALVSPGDTVLCVPISRLADQLEQRYKTPCRQAALRISRLLSVGADRLARSHPEPCT